MLTALGHVGYAINDAGSHGARSRLEGWFDPSASADSLACSARSSDGTASALFVRDTPRDELGAAPFLCLGQALYVEHRGERPIAITWRLRRPMPADTFATASVVAR